MEDTLALVFIALMAIRIMSELLVWGALLFSAIALAHNIITTSKD